MVASAVMLRVVIVRAGTADLDLEGSGGGLGEVSLERQQSNRIAGPNSSRVSDVTCDYSITAERPT
jgi:hypothetical protein